MEYERIHELYRKGERMKHLTKGAVIMAMYVALTLLISPIAYGPIQIRLSTGLYALAFHFPWAWPYLGLANGLANLFGGYGTLDVIGGIIAGLGTTYLITKIKYKYLSVLPIAIVPPLVVSTYLHVLTGLPYHLMFAYIFIGQIITAYTVGLLIVKSKVLEKLD